MNISAHARATAAARRFTRFKTRPDVEAVASRYADYVGTSDGITLTTTMSMLAYSHLSRGINRPEHRQLIEGLAEDFGLPTADLNIMAQSALGAVRCCLAGSGQTGGQMHATR